MKHLLTIAGSDSSGGAGIQADLKTFAAHGVFGMSVITAVTAQNTCGVTAVQDIDPDIITAQIDAVFSDIRVDGVKIGMVSRTESIHAIAEALKKWRLRGIDQRAAAPGHAAYTQPAGSGSHLRLCH